MKKKTIPASPELFRTALLPAALICCVLAVLCGLPVAVSMVFPEYWQAFQLKLLSGGIGSESARITWCVINGVINGACVICPAIVSVGLGAAIRNHPVRGFGFLSCAAQWTLRVVNVTGVILAVFFGYRVICYVLGSLNRKDAVHLLYSMAISEGLMVVIACFLFRCLRNFLDGAADCAASIAYTLSSGKIDDAVLPGAAERGFLTLGILAPLWAVNQLVTVTIVSNYVQSYYQVVFASDPLEYLTAATLVLNGAASILLSACLRRYNRICERAKYEARKQKQG